jgi:hypothetical protein
VLDLAKTITEFGGDEGALHFLDEPGPDLLSYATLLGHSRDKDELLPVIRAVYEWQDAPLMFLVDSQEVEDSPEKLLAIRRLLAMRGDAPYLGVAAPGRLEVYRVALDQKKIHEARVNERVIGGLPRALTLPHLANERPGAALANQHWISQVVLRLLTEAINELIRLDNVSHEDAISLVGRALFARFLADRALLPHAMDQNAATLFDDPSSAKTTSNWLDQTFNGDLLPLGDSIFAALPDEACIVLGNIMRRADGRQLHLGWEERWDRLDFAHIPVGVLSQAYELYLREHSPVRQRREGGYYTPRPIADLVVRAAFAGLQDQSGPENARVLDPAAGAGVFLLTAFRELVAAKWRSTGVRPGTEELRQILYGQITGFDINEAALRFGALGLYLMSIELDPDPQPVDKLRFTNLRGHVLYLLSDPSDAAASGLGSLGPLVGPEHHHRYDVVIGNPPWATSTKLANWSFINKLTSQIAQDRGVEGAPALLPNEVLDLPFVWRAMEWAKPEGQIAFALHARLLFQQGDGMPGARAAIFDALEVTSVINGAELRQTKVWPEITAPFCLLFARNRVKPPEAGFRFVSPHRESSLNAAGRMRIDALNAEPVAAERLGQTPELFKILFRGSVADATIIERLRSRGHPTFEALWKAEVGEGNRGRLAGAGSGYQTLKNSSRVRKNGDGKPGVDAAYLHGFPDLTVAALASVLVDAGSLLDFRHERIHDPRRAEIFKGPLMLLHQSPPAGQERITTAVCEADIAYNESFYGYSPGQHPQGGLLVRYLALILGSRFALWWALMTSGKFGVEREVVEKASLEQIPIPPLNSLDKEQLNSIEGIFASLANGTKAWEDVDQWVTSLYGLSERDLQAIEDTLTFNLPYADNKAGAEAPPSPQARSMFCEVLENELSPWAKRFGTIVSVRAVSVSPLSPWCCIEISTDTDFNLPYEGSEDLTAILRAADALAATETELRLATNRLLHARLAQSRYWTKTRARLLAKHIVWSHLDLLKSRKSA